jgi:hypothetical protein
VCSYLFDLIQTVADTVIEISNVFFYRKVPLKNLIQEAEHKPVTVFLGLLSVILGRKAEHIGGLSDRGWPQSVQDIHYRPKLRC